MNRKKNIALGILILLVGFLSCKKDSRKVEQPEIEISNLQVGKKSSGIFRLKNTGNQPLSIARVDASCGCTVPSWDKAVMLICKFDARENASTKSLLQAV
jgi:hypothetical protein